MKGKVDQNMARLILKGAVVRLMGVDLAAGGLGPITSVHAQELEPKQ